MKKVWRVFTPEGEQHRRSEKCAKCPHITRWSMGKITVEKCGKCGCPTIGLIRFDQAHCSVGHW